MTYTRAQIESGDGLLTSGEHTLIYRIAPDTYITMSRAEKPQSPDAVFVGGGRWHKSHKGPEHGALLHIDWID